MTPPEFEIQIVRQGWLDAGGSGPEFDLCSHGEIRLVIGGYSVAPGPVLEQYTISTSALALLRTLESNHAAGQGEQLILHCGMLLMTSCPIGIDWSVTHLGGRVRLHEVVRYDGLTDADAVCFGDLVVELAEDDYRRRIAAFAEEAKKPFLEVTKTPAADFDQQLYDGFWHEYETRLGRALVP